MTLTSVLRVALTKSFKPFEFKGVYSNVLNYEEEQQLGLYVHIPFCRKICSFCPYCKVLYDHSLAIQYKKALLREIELVGKQSSSKKVVTSLYFGGGTPVLMVSAIKEIVECLQKYFVITQGIGVELHPIDVTESIIYELKSAGVTMISVGIQSFQQKCLAAIGREEVDYAKTFTIIKNANFDVVDVDLIFALPDQTEELLLKDIEAAFFYGATQISTYPFIDFTFASNRYKPLPEKKKKHMLKLISDYCKKTNLERTSVWTFAKPHTGKYSSVTRDNFLGFGVSATTLLKEQFKINTFSIEGYIKRLAESQLPTSLTLDFSLRQRAAYYLFWNAYSMKINVDHFEQFFGVPLEQLFGFEFSLATRLGFMEKKDNCYHLTDKGAYYFHLIEQYYTTAYIDRMWSISRNVPFPESIVLK